MECECRDCDCRGNEICEHKRLLDEINKRKATIQEGKDRMRYVFGTFDGQFNSPQMQNVYDVLCRDD